MNFHTFFILLVSSFCARVLADVDITSPEAGDKYSVSGGSVSVKIAWKDDSDDSDDASSLTNAQAYTISLCSGDNSNIECFKVFVDAKLLDSDSYTAEIQDTDAPNGWYYFQVYTKFKGGYTNHYTPRFQLTGMSGSPIVTITNDGAPKQVSLEPTATGAPPDPQLAAGGGTGSINSASFTIPYTKQTGKTRFAPMQTQPGSKVTATTWSRIFPTSSVSYYKTIGSKPNVKSTITPGWSYTPTSLANEATVAPYPTYYYPASERVSKASLSSASKKRRWLD